MLSPEIVEKKATETDKEMILILDFGSQYTQLIARRIRELGVYCEIHPFNFSAEKIKELNPQGIILSGGPESVLEQQTPQAPEIIFNLNCPILGICYGMQTLAKQLGGRVATGESREFGYAKVNVIEASALFANQLAALDVWMSHGDYVLEVPSGFRVLANTNQCGIVAMADEKRQYYGLQFHPEVSHTTNGKIILEQFLLKICQVKPAWVSQNIIQDLIKKIRQQVKNEKVLLGLSGGVDSSVLAALLHQAIGNQLVCLFVDTGLLRLNEKEEVKQLFSDALGIHLITVDASEQFLLALEGITDPEQKRKIIGNLFIRVFEEEAQKLNGITWLAQGTIYPDVIESAKNQGSKAHLIKSHHNVGGLPEHMQLKLLEPLRDLFKDEVRQIGKELGLPETLIARHPFPGPGLAVRILGEIKVEHVLKLQKADAILISELQQHSFYNKVSQAFAVFLPIKSVGVLGDARHYDHVIALRMVETSDFMTAHVARLPAEFLEHVANRIVNEVPGVSRVVYDISGKPPATIEWE